MDENTPFEDAFNRLETIVQEMERGDMSLEQSIRKFEEGMALSRHCSAKLDQSEQRIQQLTAAALDPPGNAPEPDGGE
jgi:exodeoxyribonuclease VII small subunit